MREMYSKQKLVLFPLLSVVMSAFPPPIVCFSQHAAHCSAIAEFA
jgi:hypothetical protein